MKKYASLIATAGMLLSMGMPVVTFASQKLALSATVKPITNSMTSISGKATQGTTVKMYSNGSYKAKAKTKSNGKFKINLKAPLSTIGLYQLQISKIGFKPITKSFTVGPTDYSSQINPLKSQLADAQTQLVGVQNQIDSMQSSVQSLSSSSSLSALQSELKAVQSSLASSTDPTANASYQQTITDLQNQINNYNSSMNAAGYKPIVYQVQYQDLEQQAVTLQQQINKLQDQIQKLQDLSVQ